MGAGHLVRPLVVVAIAGSTACSIWAAIDDPYKSDGVTGAGSPPDAGLDTGTPPSRLVEAGFVPYAIASSGDTVYVVDDSASVHVAHDGGTTFAPFFSSDASTEFLPTNRIAASDAGVFWTVSSGVRYCSPDGSGCGLLKRGSAPTAIAANDSMVAWIDNVGIGHCSVPLDQCTPAPPILLNSVPPNLALARDGTIAWVYPQSQLIHFSGGRGRGSFPLPFKVDVLAADLTSGTLFWEGQDGVGFVPVDALLVDAGSEDTFSPITFDAHPNQLFAASGVAYWSLPSPSVIDPQVTTTISYCKFTDAGLVSRGIGQVNKRVAQGVVVTSRQVMAILSNPVGVGMPELFAWPAP
jgi:hypothetical protein